MTTRTDIVAGLAALAVDLDNDPRIPLPRDAQHGIAIVFSVASRTQVYAAAETQDAPVTQTRDANGARHTTAMLRYGGAVTLHVYCLEEAPAGWRMVAAPSWEGKEDPLWFAEPGSETAGAS